MPKRVGFIGLGIMGKPMATNILSKGFPLAVYNRSSAAVDELAKLGAHACQSSRQVAEHSDIILTCTFGGTRMRMKDSKYQDRTPEVNIRAAEIARKAASARSLPSPQAQTHPQRRTPGWPPNSNPKSSSAHDRRIRLPKSAL